MDIKKVSTEILDKNKWWEYKKDTIVRSDGTPGEYSYTETPGNVLVIPVLDDGRLVLVRQHRYLFDKNSIGCQVKKISATPPIQLPVIQTRNIPNIVVVATDPKLKNRLSNTEARCPKMIRYIKKKINNIACITALFSI